MTLSALSFILVHYAALIGLAVLSYAIGRKITARYQYQSAWEGAAVCTSLGLGAIASLVFVLCLAHWLYPGTVLGVLGVAAIACASELRSLATGVAASLRVRGQSARLLGVGLAGLAFLFPYALLGLYPPGETSFDALTYHLVVAKLYVQHHGFVFAPEVHWSLFPELTEMLFTLMLLLVDDIAAQLVSFLMMVVLVIALYEWGRQAFSNPVGYWAVAVFLGILIVIRLGTTAYVEMGLTLFVTTALYSCWKWLRSHAPQWLILSGIFAGCASGTKYTGLFFVALIAVVILFYGVRHRHDAAALLFVAIAMAVAAPWYARSVYYTGNPVFPFLSSLFGTGYWSAEDVADTMDHAIRNPGVGRSAAALVSLPWHLAFHSEAFRAAPGEQGPKRFFLLIPLILPLAFVDRRIAFLGAVALCYVVFWFFMSQDLRYLAPALPLLSLAVAAALYAVATWRPVGRRWAHHWAFVGIVCAALVYSSWLSALRSVRDYGALPVRQEQRDRYLTRYWPAYPAVKWLNRLGGTQYTLYTFGADTMAYFADGTVFVEDYGHARQARLFGERGDTPGLYRELEALGVNYLLLRGRPPRLRDDEFFRHHFKLVYASPPVELYEVASTDAQR